MYTCEYLAARTFSCSSYLSPATVTRRNLYSLKSWRSIGSEVSISKIGSHVKEELTWILRPTTCPAKSDKEGSRTVCHEEKRFPDTRIILMIYGYLFFFPYVFKLLKIRIFYPVFRIQTIILIHFFGYSAGFRKFCIFILCHS